MKKLIIVLAVGMLAGDGMAQTGKKAAVPPPPPPMEIKDMPAPPPPPPPPPKGVKFSPPVIVNDKGYTITVQPTKEDPVILLQKKGVTQKIRMSVWNAKPAYFENKYGKLPPPPPPAPPMPPKPPKAPVPPVKE
jgi:hypothetical protein